VNLRSNWHSISLYFCHNAALKRYNLKHIIDFFDKTSAWRLEFGPKLGKNWHNAAI